VDAIGEESSGAVSMAADLRGRSGAAAAEQTSVMVGLAAEYVDSVERSGRVLSFVAA